MSKKQRTEDYDYSSNSDGMDVGLAVDHYLNNLLGPQHFDPASDDDGESCSSSSDEEELDLYPSISTMMAQKKESSPETCVPTPIYNEFWNRPDSKVAISLILHQVDLKSLANCARVCKLWNGCINQQIFWRAMYQDYFGTITKKEIDWKNEFKQEHNNSKEICVYGGNLSRTFIFRSHPEQPHKFVPPVVCKLELKSSYDVESAHAFIYHNKVFLSFSRKIEGFSLLEELYDCIVADEENIFCKARSGEMAAFNMETGQEVWSLKVEEADDVTLWIIFDLILYENTQLLFLNKCGDLVCMDKTNGQRLYVIKGPEENPLMCASNITIHNGLFYWTTTSVDKRNRLCIAKDRKLICCADLDHVEYEFNLKIDEYGIVYLQNTTLGKFHVYAYQVDLEQQKLNLLWKHRLQPDLMDLLATASPLYYQGLVWVCLCFDAAVVALDAKTGKEAHRIQFAQPHDSGIMLTDMDKTALPLYVVDDILYYGMHDRLNDARRMFYLGAIDLRTFKQVWKMSFKSRHRTEFSNNYEMVLHPNTKMIVGKSYESLLLLWHH